jgi:Arc/MetJ-type ribon-helix-helix transcriptional regulator
MNINLTPEQEKIVQDELKSGHFRSVEQVIGEALQALREKSTLPLLFLMARNARLCAKCSRLQKRTGCVLRTYL